MKRAKSSAEVCELWRQSGDIRKWIVQWLEANSDYAMTIDMPLWAKFESNSKTPFHKCSVQELIDLSIGNLDYIKRNARGKTKWLNVLQGTTPKDSKQWWDAVKSYRMGGWALAGNVGWRGGLENVLYYVLTMRDDNAFDKGQDWMPKCVVGMLPIAKCKCVSLWVFLPSTTAITSGFAQSCLFLCFALLP